MNQKADTIGIGDDDCDVEEYNEGCNKNLKYLICELRIVWLRKNWLINIVWKSVGVMVKFIESGIQLDQKAIRME